MNVSSVVKPFSLRKIVSGVAGLILMAAPLLMAMPMAAAAGEPYNPPDDVAAYQAYTQYAEPPHIARPVPPSEYPGRPNYARRNQMEAQLDYAQVQYNRARQAGDRAAAKHWKQEIKRLRRELSGKGHAEGHGYGPSAYLPRQRPYYGPPPNTPPYGYAYPGTPYAPAGYLPSGGYPNTTVAASPYGAPAAVGGSTGGLSALLGPLLGGGATPSAPPTGYPGYPQAGYPNTAPASPYGAPATSGSMGDIMNSLIGSMRGSGAVP